MKEFDILLNERLREFNISLNKRLTECDIVVYSLPFRSGITVYDRIVLNSLINDLLSVKSIEISNSLTTAVNIDKMIKNIIESMQLKTAIEPSMQFSSDKYVYDIVNSMSFGADCLGISRNIFAVAGSSIEASVAIKDFELSSSLGTGDSVTIINSTINGMNDLEKFLEINSLCNTMANISELKVGFFQVSNEVSISDNKLIVDIVRMRKLNEMDANTLGSIDSMSLRDLDYITVQ